LLPVTSVRSLSFSTSRRPLVLSNVLVSPNIIRNLISVCRFTTNNNCSIEFDPFGLSVKDLQTQSVIARCNSMGDLYPFFSPAPPPSLLMHPPLPCGITASVTSVMRLYPSSLVPMLFHVISALILMFATLVSSAAMCASLLACQTPVHFIHLI
jgi:hypothetical protein